MLVAGELAEPRLGMFKELLELSEQYKRVKPVLVNTIIFLRRKSQKPRHFRGFLYRGTTRWFLSL